MKSSCLSSLLWYLHLQALDPNSAAAAAAAAAASDGSLEGSSRGGRDGQQKLTLEELFPGLEPHQQDAKLQEVRRVNDIITLITRNT
jgi:hypothetical protein